MATTPLGIGIDTGGTFTDIVLFDLSASQVLRKAKTPTTHGDYTVCISKAFAAIAATGDEIGRLARVCLSTTLATNTVAENKVHPSCLVVEPGDISVPADLHPALVLLKSRISFDTMEVVAVSEREVLEKTAPFAEQVESFAVSGYASTRSPLHEQQIADILRKAYGKPVVLGSELTHQLNFLHRARAAALNSGLLPVIMEWLAAVKSILAGLNITCPLYIVKGDGSLMEDQEALTRPVQTLFSGPAASLNGGSFLSGRAEAVVIDVGGTTTDIGRVIEGRGQLIRGGLRINQSHIAVDGLDMFTAGLGGDSRYRLGGRYGHHFENRRALPFCRAGEHFPHFSLETLEAELADQWHFGDPALMDLVGLDSFRMSSRGNGNLTGDQLLLVEELQQGPLTLKALASRSGVAHPLREVDELVRQRVLIRIGLTPTDVFCADGDIPGFSQADAKRIMAMHARMLDMEADRFRELAHAAIRRQATGLLTIFLGKTDPPLALEDPLLERLVEMLEAHETDAETPVLDLDPRQPLVLVGAAAALLFREVPGALKKRLVNPAHGDVANAIGAITSRFILRETLTVEPVHRGGVEVFDHQGKIPFDTLEEGLAHARRLLEDQMTRRAGELGLAETRLEWNEEIIEEYAEFSRRTRKELVIARVEAILTGIPSRSAD